MVSDVLCICTLFAIRVRSWPIAVAACSKAWVPGRLLAGIDDSHAAGVMDVDSL